MNIKNVKAKLKELEDPYDLNFIIAQMIIDERINQGLTQTALARKAGLLQEAVARIEAGKRGSTVRTLGKISKAFGKPITIKFKN